MPSFSRFVAARAFDAHGIESNLEVPFVRAPSARHFKAAIEIRLGPSTCWFSNQPQPDKTPPRQIDQPEELRGSYAGPLGRPPLSLSTSRWSSSYVCTAPELNIIPKMREHGGWQALIEVIDSLP